MTEFYVKVRPDSDSVEVRTGRIPEIELTEPAENGKANAQLIRVLAEKLNAKPAIISGQRSRRKKIKADVSKQELDEKLR